MKETRKENYIYYACAIATAKHENLYVREFVEYYLKLGVENFILGMTIQKILRIYLMY